MAQKINHNKGTLVASGQDPEGNDVEVYQYDNHVAVRAKGTTENVATAGNLKALEKEGYEFPKPEAPKAQEQTPA